MAGAECEAGAAFEDADIMSFCDGRSTKKLMAANYAFETRRLQLESGRLTATLVE